MTDPRAVLMEVLNDVLERFAFMFVELSGNKELNDCNSPIYSTSIRFKGPESGSITFYAGKNFCAELAANILGTDLENAPPDAEKDALKELTNVSCGELVAELYGETEVIDLTVPELQTIEKEEIPKIREAENPLHLWVDDYPVLIQLKIGTN